MGVNKSVKTLSDGKRFVLMLSKKETRTLLDMARIAGEAAPHRGAFKKWLNNLEAKLGSRVSAKHEWVLKGKPGLYDSVYECSKCLSVYTVSADNPDSDLPECGCGDNPFSDEPGKDSPPAEPKVLGECAWCGADAHTKSCKTEQLLCFPCAYHEAN